ncbi:MAG: futalosine hydrolase, partial [Planctomycetota bacterium]
MTPPVIVCVATKSEAKRLYDLTSGGELEIRVTGVGPVAAAYSLTRRLAEAAHPPAVICCGVGGAYPGSGLEIGDVVCASTETFGDLGVETADGFLTMEDIGFGAPPGWLDLSLRPVRRAVPFVTCATCTGTDKRAREIEARTSGAVESMEGAAIVDVARRFGVDVGEIRGISNVVGDRDRASWKLDEAADAAQKALCVWL